MRLRGAARRRPPRCRRAGVAADSDHARRIAARAARGERARAGRGAPRGAAGGGQARRVHQLARSVDRRGQHGLRGGRHPAPARRRLRDRRQDGADLPSDRRPLRADDPGPCARAELAVHPGRPDPARPCRRASSSELRIVAAPSATRRRSWASSTSSSGARRSGASRSMFEPLSADVAPQMTLFGPAPRQPRRSSGARRRIAPVRRRADAPVPVPSRSPPSRCPRSSAARSCAASATGWSRSSTRDDATSHSERQRLGQPRGRDHQRRAGDGRAARASVELLEQRLYAKRWTRWRASPSNRADLYGR